jgi:hypothetical protein
VPNAANTESKYWSQGKKLAQNRGCKNQMVRCGTSNQASLVSNHQSLTDLWGICLDMKQEFLLLQCKIGQLNSDSSSPQPLSFEFEFEFLVSGPMNHVRL